MTLARIQEFLRFCVVGGASAVSGMLANYVLTDFAGLDYRVAFVIAFLGINLASFLASQRFVFRALGADGRAEMMRYYALNGGMGLFNLVSLTVLVDVCGVWYMAALLFLTALGLPINYFLHRNVTFRVGQSPSIADVGASP